MISSSTPYSAAQIPDRYRSLETSGRLRLDEASCLVSRFAGYECGLCAESCPNQSIEITASGPKIKGECIGCGQCVGVCPSAALQTDGFALPSEIADRGEEIHVDCWRVPFQASAEGSLRVPCLGGLTKGWLLALFDRSGEKSIHLIDRGECSFCPGGAGIKALMATLTEVRMLLHACGVEIEQLPMMTSKPAHGTFSPTIPTTANEVRLDRRGFFRGLMGGVARGADEISAAGNAQVDPIILRDPALPIEQLRVATALASIARRHDRPVPTSVLPQLSLSACSAHGICVKVCPTGALERYEEGDHAELRFHAAKCIACGQCARICPDRAIRVAPSGGSTSIEVLARWQAKTCDQCGSSFFGGGSTSCAPCEKSHQLHQDVAALFGCSINP